MAVSQVSASDRALLDRLINDWAQASIVRDWDRWVAFLTDDAVIMPPDQPAVVGKAAIRKWVETFPPVTHFETKIVQAIGQGDIAMTRGVAEMTLEPAPGQQVQMTGKWVANFVRVNGKWLCCLDIWNLDHPPATP